jgi:hypothetical protein
LRQGKGALNDLTGAQAKTLMVYLAVNMPVEESFIPKDPKEMRCFDLPDECR